MSKLQFIRTTCTHPPLRQRHPALAAALVCAMALPAAMAVDAVTATFSAPWGGGGDRIDIYDPLSPTLQSFAVPGADSGKVTNHYNSVYFSGNIKVPMDASAP